MKITKLFLLTSLFFITPNLLICMDKDIKDASKSDDDEKIDIQTASESDDNTPQKEKATDKATSETYKVDLEEQMSKLDIKEESNTSPKKSLKLPKKTKKLYLNQKEITAQIAKEKIEHLDLKGLNPKNIPNYLLELLLDKKSSLRCIDISPRETKDFNGETAGKVTDVLKAIFEKIAEMLKSKVDKELKKIKIAADEEAIKKLTDDEFLKLPIQVDRKDLEKFKEDPNISSIKFGNFTIYIIPEECKSAWNTAQKVITIVGWAAAGLGWAFGIYAGVNPLTGSSSCNCTAINGTSTPAGMFGSNY